jgi:hypothetical protein
MTGGAFRFNPKADVDRIAGVRARRTSVFGFNLLAANRSQVALRVFRAVTKLGFRTVAIYGQVAARDRKFSKKTLVKKFTFGQFLSRFSGPAQAGAVLMAGFLGG